MYASETPDQSTNLSSAHRDNTAVHKADYRRLNVAAPVLCASGNLEVRLARTKSEIRACQALRYQVFFEELSAKPSPDQSRLKRDKDTFDPFCDHLVVIDRGNKDGSSIVGTYRLLPSEMQAANGFYSAAEFAIDTLLQRHPEKRFLELGRSCTLTQYRTKRTMELLWSGIWAYVRANKIDVMFGCASFPGANPQDHALPLSFLAQTVAPPSQWSATAQANCNAVYTPVSKEEIGTKQALRAMPPLVKAYLRLGAYIGSEAVVDTRFNTTDVLIIMPVERLDPRHVSYYNAKEEARKAAHNPA